MLVSPDRPARRASAGFTLAEVLIVTVLVGVGLTAVSWLMSMAARTQAVHASADAETLLLAREVRELAVTLPVVSSGLGKAAQPADIVALDSLDGATFSPPILANRKTLDHMTGWGQSIDLSLRDLDDTDVVLSETVRVVLKGERALYRLAVTITPPQQDPVTHTWWIDP